MWTCVEPLYQPLADMSTTRRIFNVSSAFPDAGMTVCSLAGSYSKPRMASIVILPGGMSAVNARGRGRAVFIEHAHVQLAHGPHPLARGDGNLLLRPAVSFEQAQLRQPA